MTDELDDFIPFDTQSIRVADPFEILRLMRVVNILVKERNDRK